MIMLMEQSAREHYDVPGRRRGISRSGSAGGAYRRGGAGLDCAKCRESCGDRRSPCGFRGTGLVDDREIGRGGHRRAVIQLNKLVANVMQLQKEQNRVMTLKPDNGELGALETVAVKVTNRIATVTLNRPRAANAINVQMTRTGAHRGVAGWTSSRGQGCGDLWRGRCILCR